MLTTGVYTADRAASLSGVPKSTIHYWAREGVLSPSVSSERVRLWSYADLMGLRVICWLRSHKTTEHGVDIPASSMRAVRAALASIRSNDLQIWDSGTSSLVVNQEGRVYIEGPAGLESAAGQLAHRDLLIPVAPFDLGGTIGPDLVKPRPMLRIVPGKLGGSPHVVDTRVETRALAALRDGGMSTLRIKALYPSLSEEQIGESLSLEEQLKKNLLAA
jgi:uncharacterized protein (DUF433 family)